ncbi:MAG TPA: AtpZ/AtpI family protein, partial [Thermoanaerobaculia bacterium]
LGLEMAGGIAGLVLVGWWVDRHFGTGPWGILTGALVGLVGGMTYLVREGLSAARAGSPRSAGGDGDPARHGSSKSGSPRADAPPRDEPR